MIGTPLFDGGVLSSGSVKDVAVEGRLCPHCASYNFAKEKAFRSEVGLMILSLLRRSSLSPPTKKMIRDASDWLVTSFNRSSKRSK